MTTIVYGKPDNQCVWCARAKKLLDQAGISYTFKDVNNSEILAELKEKFPSVKSVPQIWINDLYVGGHDDLVKFLKDAVNNAPN